VLATIFEEFHQVASSEREDRGTGIGLAITVRMPSSSTSEIR
jgi:signal transduction histidine kinase